MAMAAGTQAPGLEELATAVASTVLSDTPEVLPSSAAKSPIATPSRAAISPALLNCCVLGQGKLII